MQVKDLINYLEQEKEKGLSHVYLDQPARDHIRTLIKGAPKKAPSAPSPKAEVNEVQEIRKAFSTAKQPAEQTTSKQRPPTVTPKEPTQKVSVEMISSLELPEGTKSEKLVYLRKSAEQWSPARTLGTLRERCVFSSGNLDARIMFVGEAPGYEEELKGKPLIGRAGRKLDQILKAMGLSREEVYLTNLCKYRPAIQGQTTNNRQPTSEEMQACLPLLAAEISVIQPECVILLGAATAKSVLNSEKSIPELREHWFEYQSIPVRVTHQPAYLLRNEDNPKEKRKVWEDMLAVMEKLEIPISEKQRGYFKSTGR